MNASILTGSIEGEGVEKNLSFAQAACPGLDERKKWAVFPLPPPKTPVFSSEEKQFVLINSLAQTAFPGREEKRYFRRR